MITDSKSLFDVITERTDNTKKNLMIGLHTVKDSFQCFEITNEAIFRSKYNIAGALTKDKSNLVMMSSLEKKNILPLNRAMDLLITLKSLSLKKKRGTLVFIIEIYHI